MAEQEPDDAANERKQERFHQELRHHRAPARPRRHANRHLPAAVGGPGKEKSGQVAAGHQENERDDHEEECGDCLDRSVERRCEDDVVE